MLTSIFHLFAKNFKGCFAVWCTCWIIFLRLVLILFDVANCDENSDTECE